MKDDAQRELKPKLRFPEFQGDAAWVEGPVSNLLNVREEKRTPTPETPLFSLTIENGVTAKSDRYNREFLVQNAKKKYKVVYPNDIVYNPSNLRWGAIAQCMTNHPVLVSPIYEVLYLSDDIKASQEFVAKALMRTPQIQRFIEKGEGTLVERIAVKIDDFLGTTFAYPQSRDEQQKIADCLSSLDELIAAHSRKLDALKAHKKGLMQQLFPREGETLPRLRFPEFKDAPAWESTHLTKVADYTNGKAHEQDISEDGQFVVVNSKFISTEGEVRKFSDEAICPAVRGDILMVLSDVPNGRAIAKCFYVDEDNRYTVNQRICKLTPTAINGDFFFYVLNRNSYFLAFDDGVKQTNLRKDAVLNCPIRCPVDPEEQDKIADTLTSISQLIASHAEKLATLQTHKKGLMQQLFPSLERTNA